MKMEYLNLAVLAALMVTLNCHSNGPELKSLIGKEYQTLTELSVMKGYEKQGDMMLENLNSSDYRLSYFSNASINIIAFERVLKPVDGTVKCSLLDVLELNDLSGNQFACCGLCRLNGKNDADIIAIYQNDNNDIQFFSKVLKAWRANRKTGKIEQIDTRGVDCINRCFNEKQQMVG